MSHFAILLAGGKGLRMKNSSADKLLKEINGTNAFRLSYEAFLMSNQIENVIIAYRNEAQKKILLENVNKAHKEKNKSLDPIWTLGGMERKDSVFKALQCIPNRCEFIYVHDCARPMIQSKTINQIEKIVVKTGAVAIARPLHDTIKKVCDDNILNYQTPCKTISVDRSKIWIMETPQVSRTDWLLKGMHIAREKKIVTTDEVSVLELIGKKVSLLTPPYPNPKITSENDWPYFKFLTS